MYIHYTRVRCMMVATKYAADSSPPPHETCFQWYMVAKGGTQLNKASTSGKETF